MRFLLFAIFLVTLFQVHTALAVPVLADTGGGPISIPNPLKCDDVACVLGEVAKFLYWIAFPILTIIILWAAFLLLTAAGNENQIKQASAALKYAGIGFIVLLIAGGIPSIIRGILGA
ncbi:MAG: hypothetical protein HYS57_01525 [Parcubacteria group bacterium]|nr:hypothetical protein [Parcubacteria group bacterium]